jgi:hypothetical protein
LTSWNFGELKRGFTQIKRSLNHASPSGLGKGGFTQVSVNPAADYAHVHLGILVGFSFADWAMA